jgi:hypothetical protein
MGLEMGSIPTMSSEAEHIFSRSVPAQLPISRIIQHHDAVDDTQPQIIGLAWEMTLLRKLSVGNHSSKKRFLVEI